MNIDEMPAGREMDALISEALGFEPEISWEVLSPDEKATAFSANHKRDAEAFLSEHLKRFPDSWLKDYHVGPWKHYKPYSTDWAAAGVVIERLKGLFYQVEVSLFKDSVNVIIWKDDITPIVSADADKTAPLAICRAALKAVTP